MPIRNPFAKRPTEAIQVDENLRPTSSSSTGASFASLDKPYSNYSNGPTNGQTNGHTNGSANGTTNGTSKPRRIGGEGEVPGEYKLSVVNDNGVYLPPSPPQKPSFWPRSSILSGTRRSNAPPQPAPLAPIEPFSISRESFDSYRRSFDISARTPLPLHTSSTSSLGRQSLDQRGGWQQSRSSLGFERSFRDVDSPAERPRLEEEGRAEWEDVVLGDGDGRKDGREGDKGKKNVFARLIGGSGTGIGRKRGGSGQGAELVDVERLDGSRRPEA